MQESRYTPCETIKITRMPATYIPINAKAVQRYNAIPDALLAGTILEVGAGLGRHQLESKHSSLFLSKAKDKSYLGIDIANHGGPLSIEEADILDMDTQVKYDTVICFEVIEHICYRDWPLLFSQLKALVKREGTLILSCPYNQSIESYSLDSLHYNYHIRTVTFGITKKLLKMWLPNASFRTLRFGYVRKRKRGKDSKLRTVARYVYFLLTGNKMFFSWVPRKSTILTFWTRDY